MSHGKTQLSKSFSGVPNGGIPRRNILQMQRPVGNQSVLQMIGEETQPVRSRSSAIAGRPGNMPPTAFLQQPAIRGAGASETAPAVPQIKIPGDLQGRGQYHSVYKWLKEQATKSKKESLFGFFDSLDPQQKMAAIDQMGGRRSPEVSQVKDQMMTGLLSKSFSWDRFSSAAREAKKINVTNYNADTSGDYAGYTLTGSTLAATGVQSSAGYSDTLLGASGAKPVAAGAAPFAAGLGGIGSLAQVYGAVGNYDSALQSGAQNNLSLLDGAAGVSDATRSGADTFNNARNASGMALSGAAVAVAGAGAIVGGAAYMVGGVAGYRDAGKNIKRLDETREKIKNKEQNEANTQIGLAADLGKSTQEMKKGSSAATAAKGALMVAGGIALLAAAASPFGPILLAAAAVLGGIAAVVKFYKKQKRKETFVDTVMQIDEEMKKPENEGLGKDKVRQKVIESKGFNGTAQCYAQIVTDLSTALYEGGVRGDDEESKSVIESIGLKVNKTKQTPGKDAIAKKLHS